VRESVPILVVLFLLTACAPVDEGQPFIQAGVFPETLYLQVPAYSYIDPETQREYYYHGTSLDQIDYHSQGDRVIVTRFIPYRSFDTLSPRPPFLWDRTGSDFVMAAVFSKRIAFDSQLNRISNLSDIVWAWNTGMSTGQEGNVAYSDGCKVTDGVIQYGTTPDPLLHGQSYVFAVWAWDDEGKKVIASSREIPFTVEDDPAPRR